MKRFTIICMAMLLPLMAAAQKPVFSVKMGTQLQSSQIGLDYGNFQPYIGLDFMSIGLDGSYVMGTAERSSLTAPFVTSGEETLGLEGSVSMWMPHVGFRYYLNNNVTKPYVYAGFFKNFPSVDGKLKMEITDYDTTGHAQYNIEDTIKLDKDVKELIEELLGIWGLNFGLGAEYTVNEHFSIGGEFGFKMAKAKVDFKNEEIVEDEESGLVQETTEVEANAGLTFSHAMVSLNFHF